MIINMGPQHPSTHGVLRIMMELDGETVAARQAGHRLPPHRHGEDRRGAHLRAGRAPTSPAWTTRRRSSNELVFSLAVERLLDLEVPPRATWIRMMLCELNRMASHLLFQATNGMDIGAVSMMLYGWREREEVLRLLETITGLRMNHNFIRPGGVAADLPDGWQDDVLDALRHRRARASPSTTSCSPRTRSGCERTVGVGVHHHRAGARARRHRADPALDRVRRGTCARRSRTSRTTRSTSTSSTPRTATASTATASGSTRSSSRSRSCASASSACRAGDYRVQDRRSRRRRGRASTSRWKR